MERHGIQLDSPEVLAFCRTWKISRLEVFGSILREDFRPDSDVDFVVDFEDDAEWDLAELEQIRQGLSEIVHRDADVLTRRTLARTDNWLLRRNVLAQLETVYAAR